MTVTKDEILETSTFLRLVEIQFKEWEKVIDQELIRHYKKGEVVFIYLDGLPCFTSTRDILEKVRELVVERYQAVGWVVDTGLNPQKGECFAFSLANT